MFHKFFLSSFIFLCKILLGIFIIILPLSITSQETLSLLQEGEETYKKGEYKKSLTYWLKALSSNPNSTKALIGHAKTSLKLDSIQDAENSFQKALKLSPQNTEAIAGMGLVYLEKNESKQARNYLESALSNHPMDPHLLFALSEVYENMGKIDLAIYKLETAKKSQKFSLELWEKLGKLYILQNQLSNAESVAEDISRSYPESYLGDKLLGIVSSLQAYRSSPSSQEATRYFQRAKASLDSSLVTNPSDEETKYWLAKLLIWKGGDSKDYGKKLVEDLQKQFPHKESYTHILVGLNTDKNNLSGEEKSFLESGYNFLLEKNDLDELTRFQAEEFAIRFLPSESTFRKKLGLYRLERYSAEKNSLQFESSLFHLYRARDLIPNQPATQNHLLDAYKRSGNLHHFIQLLSQITKMDPGNFKAQNKLEQAVLLSKKTIEYREGIFYPGNQGLNFSDPTTLPKIYVMDFLPDEDMGDKVISPRTMKNAILHSLKNTAGINPANEKETKDFYNIIKNQNSSSYNPYHDSVHFDINQSPGYPGSVRFIGIGRYKDTGRSIQLEFQIYDRKTGKFSTNFRLHAKGRSSLANIATSLARKVKETIPKEGNIIKIKKEGVVINLGTRNGLSKENTILFKRDNKTLMEGTVTQLGDTISLVKPNNLYWERELATGDEISLAGK